MAAALASAVAVLLLSLAAPAGAMTPAADASLAIRIEAPEIALYDVAPPRLAAALERTTPGHWTLEWDARSGTLAGGVRGVFEPRPEASEADVRAAANAFRDQNAAPFGAANMALREIGTTHTGRAWHVTWQQMDAGRPVVGAYLHLTLHESGNVVAFRSSLVPGPEAPPGQLDGESCRAVAARRLTVPVRLESAAPVVVAVLRGESVVKRPALQLELQGGYAARWEALVDAGDGSLLMLESRLRTERLEGGCSATIVPIYAQDTPQSRPLPWLHVQLGDAAAAATTSADAVGHFTFDAPATAAAPLAAALTGDYLTVTNDTDDPEPAWNASVTVPGQVTLHFDAAQSRLDERTIYVHANRIHDWYRDRFDFRMLDFAMPAVAAARHPMTGDPDYANAYWDGQGIHFGTGGSAFFNLGLFADIVYHEYGHAVTDYMYRPFGGLGGMQGGAIHEALSDYFACTIIGEPRVGENAPRDGLVDALRNLENGLQWPQDRINEIHADGEILAGALWDIRRLLGPDIADALVHYARTELPRSFDQYAAAILVQDDLLYGDGQAANGSPHRDALCVALGAHGLGPAAGTGRELAHEPLRDTETVGRPRAVQVGFENHLSTSTDSLTLVWSVGGPFLRSAMQRVANGQYAADIPGASLQEGVRVRYYVSLTSRRRNLATTLPPGAPDSTYAFRVGADHEPPHVAHVPVTSAAAFAWPARVLADIDDNLGVANAWVEYTRNGVPGPLLGMTRSATLPGRRTAQFPNVGVEGDVIEYRIVAVDASRAANRREIPGGGAMLRFQLVNTLSEDFEGGAAAWQHGAVRDGAPDPWRVGSDRNHTPSGQRAWVCGLPDAEYAAGTTAALETERYRLGTGAGAHIWSQLDAEPNGPAQAWDAAVIQVQLDDDSAAWETIAPQGGYTHHTVTALGGGLLPAGTPCLSGRETRWRQLRFDLGAFARRSVRLRFLFLADGVASPFNLHGWALDDFGLDPGSIDPTDSDLAAALPARLLLHPPAPNPFNPSLEFGLAVPAAAGRVRLTIFDASGRRVRALLDARLEPGPQRLRWDGRGEGGLALPSGVYYYRLASRLGVERGSVVLLR